MELRRNIVFLLVSIISVVYFALTIYSETGTLVYFDGKYIGTVQKDGKFVFNFDNPGTLVVTKPGYLPFEIYVTEDSTLTAKLSLPAYLEIKTEPADCEIYVNDKKVGTGNGKYTLEPGKVQIKISKEGYTTKIIDLNLDPLQKQKIDVSLKNTTTLKLISQNNLTCFLNGNLIDIPTILEIIPGEHMLTLSPEYINYEQKIVVPNVDYYEYIVDTRKYVKVHFNANVPEAYVDANGLIYKIPASVNLEPGSYTLRFFASGYKDIEMQVMIDKETGLFLNFEPEKNILPKIENVLIELDGYPREKVVEKFWFTKLTDMISGKVWYGFTNGKLKGFPTTEYLIISNGYVELSGFRYNAPIILNVPKGTQVFINSQTYKGIFKVENSEIIDSKDYCVVNLYSDQVYEVFLDGKHIGRAPYYFLVIPQGKHLIQTVKDGIIVNQIELDVMMGVLNEVRLD